VLGHPPPVVRGPDGRVRFLEPARGMPICATLGAEYEETEVAFAPGSTLVLYTDGLVERRGESLDAGLQRLANAVLTGPRDVDALADHLLTALLAHDAPTDDVALLIVHFEQDRSRFSACLHADPRDLAQLRRSFSDWLITAGADEDTRADVVLAVNEAVANAMEHAYGPVDAMVEVTGLARDPGVFEVWVRDFGRWRADRPHAGGGRGLILMRNLMDTVTVDNSEHGTTVHLTRARRNAATATGDGVEQRIR
jgi:anti-sigma regulatory factor (Ser/Thr protein kinase)